MEIIIKVATNDFDSKQETIRSTYLMQLRGQYYWQIVHELKPQLGRHDQCKVQSTCRLKRN
jgi:hypothetical protein